MAQRQTIRRQQRGVVMIGSYFVVAVLLILQGAYVSRMTHDHDQTLRVVAQAKALSHAEAGLDDAMTQLRENPTYDGTDGIEPFGDGGYAVAVSPHPQNSDWMYVQVSGYYPMPQTPEEAAASGQGVSAVLHVTQHLFSYALLGDKDFKSSGSLIVDSYNSQDSPPVLGGRKGDIATNEQKDNAMQLNGLTDLHGGDIVVGPDGGEETVKINGLALYDELRVMQAEWPFPPLEVPEAPDNGDVPPEVGHLLTLQPGSYDGEVRLGKWDTLLLDGAGDYVLEGVEAERDTQIMGNAAGPITIYITKNDFRIKGTLVSNGDDPTQLTINVMPNAGHFHMEKTSTVYAAVYVPDDRFHVKNDSTLYGAAMVKDVDASGNTVIHYDEALSNGGEKGEAYLVVWRRNGAAVGQ